MQISKQLKEFLETINDQANEAISKVNKTMELLSANTEAKAEAEKTLACLQSLSIQIQQRITQGYADSTDSSQNTEPP